MMRPVEWLRTGDGGNFVVGFLGMVIVIVAMARRCRYRWIGGRGFSVSGCGVVPASRTLAMDRKAGLSFSRVPKSPPSALALGPKFKPAAPGPERSRNLGNFGYAKTSNALSYWK